MNDDERIARDRGIIASSSFNSDGHGVLYSGPGNHDRALDAAKSDGAVPIDHTEGGQRLSEPNRYQEYDDFAQADNMNREASAKYSSELSGNVDTYVVGASEDRIFRDAEQEVLLNSENVETVNGVPREEIKGLHDKDPEAAFNKICESELARDRSSAESTGDGAKLADVESREQTYQQQLEQQGRTPENATEPYPEKASEATTTSQADDLGEGIADRNQPTERSTPQNQTLETQTELQENTAEDDLGEGIADRHQAIDTPEATTAEGQSESATDDQLSAQAGQDDLGEGIADREPPPPPPPPSAEETSSMSM